MQLSNGVVSYAAIISLGVLREMSPDPMGHVTGNAHVFSNVSAALCVKGELSEMLDIAEQKCWHSNPLEEKSSLLSLC